MRQAEPLDGIGILSPHTGPPRDSRDNGGGSSVLNSGGTKRQQAGWPKALSSTNVRIGAFIWANKLSLAMEAVLKICHMEIRNFRGIRTLSWRVKGNFSCLIGPGDTCKTTILTALDYALSPRAGLFLDDADFFNQDVS